MKTIIVMLLLAASVASAQLPSLGVKASDILNEARARGAVVDSIMKDRLDKNGNEVLSSYKIAPVKINNVKGLGTFFFDESGKLRGFVWHLSNDWGGLYKIELTGKCSPGGVSPARFDIIREELVARYGEPAKKDSNASAVKYSWSENPDHTLMYTPSLNSLIYALTLPKASAASSK
jgi:hypothetical protein